MDIFNFSVLLFVPFKKGIVPFLKKEKRKIKLNKERKEERKKMNKFTAKKKKKN